VCRGDGSTRVKAPLSDVVERSERWTARRRRVSAASSTSPSLWKPAARTPRARMSVTRREQLQRDDTLLDALGDAAGPRTC